MEDKTLELDKVTGVVRGHLTRREVVVGFEAESGWWVHVAGTVVTLGHLTRESLLVMLDISAADKEAMSVLDELEALRRQIKSGR